MIGAQLWRANAVMGDRCSCKIERERAKINKSARLQQNKPLLRQSADAYFDGFVRAHCSQMPQFHVATNASCHSLHASCAPHPMHKQISTRAIGGAQKWACSNRGSTHLSAANNSRSI